MSRTLLFLLAALAATLAIVFINRDSGMTLGMTNDKFVSVASLVLILAAVGIRFIGHGQPLSQTLRHLGFWIVIGVGLVGAYQYRFPIQDFASKVSLGLVPSRPHSSTGEDGALSVTLGKANSGHFEVDAQVNGKSTHFLIDTGASGVVLTAFDATNIGINIDDLSFIAPVSTANGSAMAAPVTLDQIVIGGIVRKNVNALVAQQGRLDQSLLGMDYLNTLSSFTVKQDEMLLQD